MAVFTFPFLPKLAEVESASNFILRGVWFNRHPRHRTVVVRLPRFQPAAHFSCPIYIILLFQN